MPLENTDEDEKKLDKAEIALSEAKNVPTLDDRQSCGGAERLDKRLVKQDNWDSLIDCNNKTIYSAPLVMSRSPP